jgi:hypothetical protein
MPMFHWHVVLGSPVIVTDYDFWSDMVIFVDGAKQFPSFYLQGLFEKTCWKSSGFCCLQESE